MFKKIDFSGLFGNILTLCVKEVRAYFNSPTAYVVIVVFLLISGWFFTATLFLNNQATIDQFLGNAPLLFIFIIPAISMRLLAEEVKEGTIEVLATLPIKDYEIVIGKFAAALCLLAALLAMTLIFPVSLAFIARGGLDWGQIAGSYLGLLLVGAAYLAMGLFASSITRNQIIAFIIGFVICFAFFIFGKIVTILPGSLGALVAFLGMDSHLDNISKGVIDTRDVLYLGCLAGFFIHLAIIMVNARKWK